jgi:hypothetical protein
MRSLITLALAAAAPALFANGNTATASAEVGVKIFAPIAIVNPDQSKLDFGMVTVSDPGQPIKVTYPAGSPSASYENCDPYTGTSVGGQAWFHIRKDHDLGWGNVQILVPASVDLGGGVQVATDRQALQPCYTLNGQPVFLSNTTWDDMKHFYVGGTLTAPKDTYGTFSGLMTVTASYQ